MEPIFFQIVLMSQSISIRNMIRQTITLDTVNHQGSFQAMFMEIEISRVSS